MCYSSRRRGETGREGPTGSLLTTYLPVLLTYGPSLHVCVIAHADEAQGRGRRAAREGPTSRPLLTAHIRAIVEAGTPRYGSTGGGAGVCVFLKPLGPLYPGVRSAGEGTDSYTGYG